jgi:NAD(P)-dependent dehydrogenase (short-subunit alcohol dehydrogenase family)
MLAIVIAGGLASIVVLATLVGLALARQAREAAWDRIATSRRINAERARELNELAASLDVRSANLDIQERRLKIREEILSRRESTLQSLENELRRQTKPPELPA